MNIVDDRHDFRPAGTERWLKNGFDYVVHSLTKYICGHDDALGGAVIVRDRARLVELREGALVHRGAALNPFAAWLIARGLETLPSRMFTHDAPPYSVWSPYDL